MNSSYSWRPGMETSGVAGKRVLLRLREITAMRQPKADHSLTVKATKPKIQGDSKRRTQLNSKWRFNTHQTVGCGIPSSLLALRFDLCGLRSKLS